MFKIVSVLFVLIAGIVHLVIVPAHLAHAPAHGITFLMIGLAQLMWCIAFLRFSIVGLIYWTGIALSGGVLFLWVLTQIFSPPFAAEPEPIDLPTVITKTAEGIAFLSLLLFAQKQRSQPAATLLGGASAVVLAVGGGMLVAGYAAQPLLPQLGHVGTAYAHTGDDAHAYGHEEAHLHENSGASQPQPVEDHHSESEMRLESHAHVDEGQPHLEGAGNDSQAVHSHETELTAEHASQADDSQTTVRTDHHDDGLTGHSHETEVSSAAVAAPEQLRDNSTTDPETLALDEEPADNDAHSHGESDHSHLLEAGSEHGVASHSGSVDSALAETVAPHAESIPAAGDASPTTDAVSNYNQVPAYPQPWHWNAPPSGRHPVFRHPVQPAWWERPPLQNCPVELQRFRDRWRFAQGSSPYSEPVRRGWSAPLGYQ